MKIIKYLAISISLFGLASCSDYFETESPSSSDASVYKSLEKTEQVIGGIYNMFLEDKSYRNRLSCGYQGMNTDIEYNNKTGDAELEATRYNMLLVNTRLSQSTGKDPWGYLTGAIERANLAIDGIRTVSDMEKQPKFKYYLGEVLFLRAFIYLEMIKIWGDVPARFEPLLDLYAPKTSRNIVFEQIRTDLKLAADLMEWSKDCKDIIKDNVTRPNRGAALGLLARADLMYAGKALRPDSWIVGGGSTSSVDYLVDATKRQELYQEAMNACGRIISEEGVKSMTKPYDQVFKELCADNISYEQTEYLWVMPMNDGARGQFLNYNTIKSSDAYKALLNNTSGSTNSVQSIVPTFVYDFEDGDARKWVTIAPFSWTAKDDGTSLSSDPLKREVIFPGSPATEKKLYQKQSDIASFYLGKYRVEWMNRDRNTSEDGVDYPIIRYADVLLMFAEASIGGISGDAPTVNTYGIDAQAQFDAVRARAGLAPKALTMDNIINERAFEFCGEYIRKYDLMRWGKLKEKLVQTTTRLGELDAHTGEFANTSDTIYFKYKQNDALVYSGSTIVNHAYEMDQIHGLAKNQNSAPVGFDENLGWVSKDIFVKETVHALQDNYALYVNEDLIESRQYWPIFSVNVGASNGSLWNDYNY